MTTNKLRDALADLLLFENDDSQADLKTDPQLREERARAVERARVVLDEYDAQEAVDSL